MILKTIVLVLILMQQINVFAKEFQSGESQVKLIELYSSEGCSSCPPAEAQLAKLTDHKNLWKTFVPINFHVDYWNRLGWVDPYSNAAFTERQRSYARLWKVKTVYTPAFVSNGESLGSTLNIGGLLEESKKGNSIKITANTVSVKKSYIVNISAANLDEKKVYQIHVALLGNGLVSDVTSGENKGEILIQNFVALKHESKAYSGKGVTFEIKQPESLKVLKYGLALWITEQDQLAPLQVVGGYL